MLLERTYCVWSIMWLYTAPHGVHIPVDYLNLVYCKDGCNDPSLLIHLKILDICNLSCCVL